MNKKDLSRLQNLKRVYEYSQRVCDPYEFANRQKILLEYVVKHLLEPLFEEEKKEIDKKSKPKI